jgi:hypothetical protein
MLVFPGNPRCAHFLDENHQSTEGLEAHGVNPFHFSYAAPASLAPGVYRVVWVWTSSAGRRDFSRRSAWFTVGAPAQIDHRSLLTGK